MTAPKALITGITGQDGSYLAELLVEKDYDVHGIVRRVAIEDPEHRLMRLEAIRSRITLHAASLESYASIHQVVASVVPDECYHLAAQSFVSYSFDDEFSTLNATGETHTVREFAEVAFTRAGLDYREYVTPDPDLFRPAEVNLLQGDAAKARNLLGWRHRITFEMLVGEMVEADLLLFK